MGFFGWFFKWFFGWFVWGFLSGFFEGFWFCVVLFVCSRTCKTCVDFWGFVGCGCGVFMCVFESVRRFSTEEGCNNTYHPTLISPPFLPHFSLPPFHPTSPSIPSPPFTPLPSPFHPTSPSIPSPQINLNISAINLALSFLAASHENK